jgi:hypothetical protein
MAELRLDAIEPIELARADLADAADGLQEILDAVEAGTLDLCPPLNSVLVRVLEAIERLLIRSS